MKGGFGKVYQDVGVKQYYEQSGSNYSNPHKYDIQRLIKKKLRPTNNPHLKVQDSILDLACGSGQVTLPLLTLGYKTITGVDPYTRIKYEQMTGLPCGQFTFLDILEGVMDDRRFDAIVVSYALHLVKEGMMHDFCTKLAELGKKLLIISPHKFPVIKESYGWKEVENCVMDRIHLRIFQSLLFEEPYEQKASEQKPQYKVDQPQNTEKTE